MLVRLALCGAMAAARLVELAYSRQNIARGGPSAEGEWSRRTYPGIVALHTAIIGATALFGRGAPRFPWLLLLLAAQPVRVWLLLTLGRRWNARGAVSSDLSPATGGPYAYVRHPNYVVVFVELLALPLTFRLSRLAVAGALLHSALLALRIRDEEALLEEVPGYREHFDRKARFIPGVA